MFQKMISVILILAFFAGASGCTTFGEEHKGATTGAGIGAATGAVAGALLGSKGAKTEMALLGALAGALAGGLIGHYAYDQKRTQEETARKYDYNASQGPLLRIEDVSAVPAAVKAGDTVEMKMTYALLGAGAGKETAVTETREIRYEGELYGKPQINTSRADGTYVTSLPLTLPSDAKKGKYSVISTVQSPSASDSKEVSFQVN